MEYEVKKYGKYKREIRFMLIGSGLWPDYKGHPRPFKTFLSVLSAFSSATTTFTMANFCAHNLSSINILTRGLGLCIGFWSIFLKVCKLFILNISIQLILVVYIVQQIVDNFYKCTLYKKISEKSLTGANK